MECYTVIFDSFKWLPHYGENTIVIHPRKKGCITVDIYYDNNNKENEQEYPFAKRSYIFKSVSSFYEGIWSKERGGIDPICPVTPCKTNAYQPTGVLFEINNSLLAKEWDEYRIKNGYKDPIINRHFRQYFWEYPIMIDVVCEDVELTDEIFLKTEEGE